MKKQEKEIATNVSSGAEKVETIEKEVKKNDGQDYRQGEKRK